MKNTDYIIVGQGIAGTNLAFTLQKGGSYFFIIDDSSLSSCSRIAAGNINPVVFKRLVKSWKVDDALPFADTFYKQAETFLNQSFYRKKEIAKVFAQESEKKFWLSKRNDDITDYIYENVDKNFPADALQKNSGVGMVQNSFNLSSAKFISDWRSYFIKQNLISQEKFDFDALKIGNDSIQYKQINAKKIIFCEGWLASKNPFFSYLPFKPAKGEMLTVKIPNLSNEKVIHKGISLTPIGDDLFLAGSTYEWNDLNETPSKEKKKFITEKLKDILKIPFTVVEHKAAVRPATQDRRPFIGLHSKHKQLGIFNGFGTKAVLLSPFYAAQFVGYLEEKNGLDDEVNIKRFS